MTTKNVYLVGSMVLELGMIIVSRRLTKRFSRCDVNAVLIQHMTGDWGDVNDTQWKANELAIQTGDGQVLSSFIFDDERILIMTDAERQETICLLSDEYWE